MPDWLRSTEERPGTSPTILGALASACDFRDSTDRPSRRAMSVDAVTVRVFAIVEDDADSRMVVRMLLCEDPRFSVAGEVASAEEAIEMVRKKRPDLIVLDHNLEGSLTGLDVAPLLKVGAPEAKVILFTGDDEIRDKALEADSVDAYLPKSHPDELLPTACRLLGLW